MLYQLSYYPTRPSLTAVNEGYLTFPSLCRVCDLQCEQYFFKANFSGLARLFLSVV